MHRDPGVPTLPRLTARIPRSCLTAVPRLSEDQPHSVGVPTTAHRPVQLRHAPHTLSPATASTAATVAGLLHTTLSSTQGRGHRCARWPACPLTCSSLRKPICTHTRTALPVIKILAALLPLNSVRFHLDADHAAPLPRIKDIPSRFQCKLAPAAAQLGRCFAGSFVSVSPCCPPRSATAQPVIDMLFPETLCTCLTQTKYSLRRMSSSTASGSSLQSHPDKWPFNCPVHPWLRASPRSCAPSPSLLLRADCPSLSDLPTLMAAGRLLACPRYDTC